MVERASRRSDLVARVDPDLCVSCGICAGSCSPMGVGPPGRTGRDQIVAVRDVRRRAGAAPTKSSSSAALMAPGNLPPEVTAAGGVPYPIDCAGNLHTSVIETPAARRRRRRARPGVPAA